LEDPVGLFLAGDDIAQLIEAEDGDPGVIIDQVVKVLGFGQFGIQVKEGEKESLIAFNFSFTVVF